LLRRALHLPKERDDVAEARVIEIRVPAARRHQQLLKTPRIFRLPPDLQERHELMIALRRYELARAQADSVGRVTRCSHNYLCYRNTSGSYAGREG